MWTTMVKEITHETLGHELDYTITDLRAATRIPRLETEVKRYETVFRALSDTKLFSEHSDYFERSSE